MDEGYWKSLLRDAESDHGHQLRMSKLNWKRKRVSW